MDIKSFSFALTELKNAASAAAAKAKPRPNSTVIPSAALKEKPKIYDFHDQREKYLISSLKGRVEEVRKNSASLASLASSGKRSPEILAEIYVNIKFLEEYANEPAKVLPIVDKINRLTNDLILFAEEESEFSSKHDRKQSRGELTHSQLKKQGSLVPLDFSIPKVPEEIRSEVYADIDELKRAFGAGCYRSSVIICGRVLEAALHRKYFDATGQDVLEKNPGIGLGTLVAKLSEKNIKLDVGITQQIHLINQVRIFSVHKKQEAFNPSKDQTQAIILYTMDIINKLF
jgi:hypothetical protein